MKELTVGELKKIIENVPDDYICTMDCEGMIIVSATIVEETKTVDFCY